MEAAIERALSVAFVVVGVSHAVQPRLWGEFFTELFRSRLAPVVVAVFTMPWALLVVAGHNVWAADTRVITTIAGWSLLTKCSLYLIVPQVARKVASQDFSRRWKWVAAGVFSVALGVAMGWRAWGR